MISPTLPVFSAAILQNHLSKLKRDYISGGLNFYIQTISTFVPHCFIQAYLVSSIAHSKVVKFESSELVTPTVSGGNVKKPNVACKATRLPENKKIDKVFHALHHDNLCKYVIDYKEVAVQASHLKLNVYGKDSGSNRGIPGYTVMHQVS